jgi:hypothetical protein
MLRFRQMRAPLVGSCRVGIVGYGQHLGINGKQMDMRCI